MRKRGGRRGGGERRRIPGDDSKDICTEEYIILEYFKMRIFLKFKGIGGGGGEAFHGGDMFVFLDMNTGVGL